jgi:zinc protease
MSRESQGVERSVPPAPGPIRPFSFPLVERTELNGGLTVVSARTGEVPVVTLELLLPAGGLQDPAGREGLATLTGALLDSGAGSRTAAEIAEEMEALGVQLSVATGWQVTHVELTGLRSRMEAAVDLLADLVREPTFPQHEVERIAAEHRAAILQRRAEPRGLANEAISRFLFADASPFSRPLGGTLKSLGTLTREDLRAFHQAHYSPLGAAVVVAGEMDHAGAVELAARAFGDWVGPAAAAPVVSVEPRSTERRITIVDRPGAVQSEIRVAEIGVARSTPDYFPIVVMNAILGGAFTSRLNLNLRETRGYTYGVSSSFTMRREPGPFLVSTAVQTEATAPALSEIMKELRTIREEPVREQEVEDARSYLAGVFPLRLQTTDGTASRLAELFVHDLPLDYFADYRERLLAVSRAEVERAAREHIDPSRTTIVVAGDAARIRDELAALDLGPVDVTDAGDLP